MRAAGVPYVTLSPEGKRYVDFHALRHTYLTSLSEIGAGAKELQGLARHADPRLTLGVYIHARADALGRTCGFGFPGWKTATRWRPCPGPSRSRRSPS